MTFDYSSETALWTTQVDFPGRHPASLYYRRYDPEGCHYKILAVGHLLQECSKDIEVEKCKITFRHCKCAHYEKFKGYNKIDGSGTSENKSANLIKLETKEMNSKLTKVNPLPTTGQYIQGSTASNYFLITNDSWKGVVAFRPTSTSIPALGTSPKTGQETRVRVVPATDTAQLATLMTRFGFTRTGGSNGVHYSQVTTDAPKVIADANLALSIAA